MVSSIFSILLSLVSILCFGQCEVTDKEYARLPPVFEQDNFDRCMLLEDEALYCSIEFHLQPKDAKYPSQTWRNIQEVNSNPKNYHHDNLRHGICVPFTCPNISTSYKDPRFRDELAECYSNKYERQGLNGTIGYMHCQTTERAPFDIYDSIVAIMLSIYIIFLIYASLFEGIARYKPKEEYEKITGTTYGKVISCFSITRNWIRLKTVNWTPELKALKAIQGIRFYSMLLVITCHTCMMAGIGPVANTKYLENFPDHPLAIFIASGPYGVEGFFILSSWMLTYNVFKLFDKKSGKEFSLKTMFTIFVHRYLRLTPSLAFMILLHSTLLYHSSIGPWWDLQMGKDRTFCRQNGWTNLLYINNIFNPSEMCLIETWYMAVDMHGFFLVLAILYFTVKKPQRLWWIIPSVWMVIQIIHVKSIYDNEIYTFFIPYAENMYLVKGLFNTKIWITTLASTSGNMAGTLVGMVAGYVYYKYENEEFIPKKIYVVLWWLLTFGMGLAIVVLPGLWIFSKNYYPTLWFSLPYFFFNTIIFGLAVAILLNGFTKGIGWMAKWCVEWEPLYVLARLSYSSFLVHYTIGVFMVGSSRNVMYSDDLSIIFEIMKLLTASFFFGLILTMTVEMPVTALQSTFLKKNSGSELRKYENRVNKMNENKQKGS